jgi:hypothetical protein
LDERRTAAREILDCVADAVASQQTRHSQYFTASLEDVLQALYGDSGVQKNKLRSDLQRRVNERGWKPSTPP